jgi:dTDP-4-dehydrorhamnose reductase
VDLLVIGGSGFLGRRITRQAQLAGHGVIATFHASVPPAMDVDWRMVDIRHRDDVAALARRARPEVVINAAYRQADWETTAEGGMHVAVAAAAIGARLVHVSSDAVFSGAAPSYDETSQPDPVTPYGGAKAAAETAVKGIAPAAIIARTSLIIGDGDSPHERLVHALASGTAAGSLYTDDVRCPVHVSDLAAALLELAAAPHAGVCHVTGSDAISRYELGLLIAARDGLDQAALRPGLRAATGIPGALEVRLDCSKTQARLNTRLRGAREFLAPSRGLLLGCPGDPQPEGGELVEWPVVAALDVVHSVQHRRAVGDGRGEHRGEASAHVRQFDLGAVQLGYAPDDRRVHGVPVVEAAGGTAEAGSEHLDLAAHLLQRGHVHETVLEYRFV